MPMIPSGAKQNRRGARMRASLLRWVSRDVETGRHRHRLPEVDAAIERHRAAAHRLKHALASLLNALTSTMLR